MSEPLSARASVFLRLAEVHDPEYPGISIVDLGLVEGVAIDDLGRVSVALVPTFSGCPALALIADDVRLAVSEIPEVVAVEVRWLHSPVWTTERISSEGVRQLAEGFTVAVALGDQVPGCPRCGAELRQTSLFGPSRCRSVHRCDACHETVESFRGVPNETAQA